MGPSGTKDILTHVSLFRFYVLLTLTLTYFVIQLVTAHLTHSLILQIDAYHMLYNVLSLLTCIVTVNLCQKGPSWQNTFGWTRIHVCGIVASTCFLAALAFSVTVEALQTIIHVDHHDSMHHSAVVGVVGAAGLLVNSIAFFMVGGYTFHQSSFLDSHHQHQVGDDFVISASVQAYVKEGMKSRRRQGLTAIFRDIFGSVLVVVVAGVLYYVSERSESEGEIVVMRYIDPGATIGAVVILSVLSYNLGRDAGHILLLTIPNQINLELLLQELRHKFQEEILDIHDFHIWQLTPQKIVASAHVVYRTLNYLGVEYNVVDFLHSNGISHITLQPEFVELSSPGGSVGRPKCFLPCEGDCETMQCCTEAEVNDQEGSGSKGDIPLLKVRSKPEVGHAAELQPMI